MTEPNDPLVMLRLHQQMKINGTGTLTLGQLEEFVHKATSREVPATAEVEVWTETADRPGEYDMWHIAISWSEEVPR